MSYVGSTLREYSLHQPDKLAVSSEKLSMTYKEMYGLVTTYQQALLKYTGEQEKCIGIHVEDSLSFLALFFAIVRNGWQAMPIDSKWTQGELNDANEIASPDHIITDCVRDIEEKGFLIGLNQLFSNGEVGDVTFTPDPMTDFYVGFTSGSSGKPKGFTRSHKSWTESFSVCEETFHLTKDDAIISPGPLCHSLSLFTAVHTIQMGATLHVAETFNRTSLVERIHTEGINTFVGVPTMVEALLEECQSRSLQYCCIKNLIISGAGWSSASKEKTLSIFPYASLFEYYGASELSFVMYKKDWENGHRPFPDVSIRILDEHFHEAKIGEVGKVFVTSRMLYSGYLDQEEETQRVLTAHGATVGDVGYKNEFGEVFLVGRESNMIKSGGLKVYPEEVEAILQTHPDIVESIVYPVEDHYWGEMVVCSLKVKNHASLTMEGLKQFCKAKIADYKIPKQILPLPTFYYTKSGKIDRKATLEGRTSHLRRETE